MTFFVTEFVRERDRGEERGGLVLCPRHPLPARCVLSVPISALCCVVLFRFMFYVALIYICIYVCTVTLHIIYNYVLYVRIFMESCGCEI